MNRLLVVLALVGLLAFGRPIVARAFVVYGRVVVGTSATLVAVGGGASFNGSTSGAGGAGGAGIIRVVSYF